jgi:hypothetical protein
MPCEAWTAPSATTPPRAFAIQFYGALGSGRSIGNAVAQGVATLAAKQLPDEASRACVSRDGVDPHEVILGAQP